MFLYKVSFLMLFAKKELPQFNYPNTKKLKNIENCR